MDAKEMWDELRLEILRRTDEIDKATPWQEVEPSWWLHMQGVRTAAAAWKGTALSQEPQ